MAGVGGVRAGACCVGVLFSGARASQRLTVLVAGETIRYHGGRYGAAFEKNEAPSLYIELPLAEDPSYG